MQDISVTEHYGDFSATCIAETPNIRKFLPFPMNLSLETNISFDSLTPVEKEQYKLFEPPMWKTPKLHTDPSEELKYQFEEV